MSIIAFNFTKLAGERKTAASTKFTLQSAMGITSVKEQSLGSQKALLFTFQHVTNYQPGIATLTVEGEVVVLSNEKQAKEVVENFAKTKTFEPQLTQKVLNTIISRVSVQNIIMARDLNLPSPVKLPRFAVTAKDEKAPAGAKPVAVQKPAKSEPKKK